MFSYYGLEQQLAKKGITKTDLSLILGISSRTIAKISKGERIAPIVIKKMCDYFSCEGQDIFREISDNPLLQMLRDEKMVKYRVDCIMNFKLE